MQVYDVNVSLIFMAESRESAMQEAVKWLAKKRHADMGFVVHDAAADERYILSHLLEKKGGQK